MAGADTSTQTMNASGEQTPDQGRNAPEHIRGSDILDTGHISNRSIGSQLTQPGQNDTGAGDQENPSTGMLGNSSDDATVTSSNLGDAGRPLERDNIDTAATGAAGTPSFGNTDPAGTGNMGYAGLGNTGTAIEESLGGGMIDSSGAGGAGIGAGGVSDPVGIGSSGIGSADNAASNAGSSNA